MLVVGSANSSNSQRLAEVATRLGVRAHLVDGSDDIRLEWLRDVTSIGVTAGASAPESKVVEVVAAISSLGVTQITEHRILEESITFKLPLEVRS